MSQAKEAVSIRQLGKRKLFFLSILGVGVCLALAGWSVQKVMQTWSLNQEVVEVHKKTEEVRKKAVESQAILSSTEYLRSQAIVDKALPDKKPFLELLSNLDRVGKATGVSITNITLSPGSLATSSATRRSGGSGNYEHIDLSFQVTSTFDGFRDFMQTMEQVVPFTSVMKFSIAEAKDQNNQEAILPGLPRNASEQMISVTLDTYTYFYSAQANQVVAIKTLDPKEVEILSEVERLQAVDLPEQTEITGGGLEDLFGVAGYREIIQGF